MSRPYLNYASVICDKIFKNLSSFYYEMHCTLLMVLVALLCERMSPFNLLPVNVHRLSLPSPGCGNHSFTLYFP